jgi:hypothetical protein
MPAPTTATRPGGVEEVGRFTEAEATPASHVAECDLVIGTVELRINQDGERGRQRA